MEELEQSLTKEDNLVESNLLIGDKESERKNNKNRKREESLDAQDNDDDKENQDSVKYLLIYICTIKMFLVSNQTA